MRNDCGTVAVAPEGPVQVKPYKVSPGKRELLTALLIRDDVPLRVRGLPDGIEVHGSQHQQEAFAAFLRAIESQSSAKQWREYSLPEGKLEALYALMARDDVPIFVSTNDGKLRAEVTDEQHAMMQRFISLLQTGGGQSGASAEPSTMLWRYAVPGQSGASGTTSAVTPLMNLYTSRAQAADQKVAAERLRNLTVLTPKLAETLKLDAGKLRTEATAK